MSDSARDLGERVTDRYAQISARIDKTASDVTQKGQDVRDGFTHTALTVSRRC